jgi:hypothetical protein
MPTEDIQESQVLQLARALAGVIKAEREYPGRRELRQRLEAIAKAARLLHRELSDATILSHLFRNDQTSWSVGDENQWMADLERLAVRADASAADVRTGRGSYKDFARPDGLSAKTICALLIIECRALGGKDTPTGSLEAQGECEHLWRMAGGESHSHLIEDPRHGMWHSHLEQALKLRDHPEGAILERIVG